MNAQDSIKYSPAIGGYGVDEKGQEWMGYPAHWEFQTISPVRMDAVEGIMDDLGNFQEVLRGRVILRAPGAWW